MKLPISDYVALRQAGYTADEIASYTASIMDEAQTSTPVEKPVETVENITPVENTQPSGENVSRETPENETQSMLREMLGLMKAGNINNLSHGGETVPDAAQVMASILAPNPKIKKE